MFGARSKRLYVILAIVYGLVFSDLLFYLVRGDGNGASAVLAVVFGAGTYFCIRAVRRPVADSQPRIR